MPLFLILGTGSKCEVDQATLKKRIPLLTRYIDHKENLELQALYAVQHLMTDLNQPKGKYFIIIFFLFKILRCFFLSLRSFFCS